MRLNSRRPDVDVVVLGAGAAGLMCALQAGQRGRRVLVVDHWHPIGERIRISGGGRCNFTNRSVSAANYLSRNPRFCVSALSRFPPSQFVAMLDHHGVAYQERDRGQLFCVRSADDITQMLTRECADAGVRIASGCRVIDVSGTGTTGDPEASRFLVSTSDGTFLSSSLAVATGGLAVPKLGATPLGYRLAEQFGMRVIPPRPALVPLALQPEMLTALAPLSGVAFEAGAACAADPAPRFLDSVLLTHQGMSGPAILQVSSYWQAREYSGDSLGAVALDLLPGLDAGAWIDERRSRHITLAMAMADTLPRRFAATWCDLHGFATPLNQMPKKDRLRAAKALNAWTIVPSGTLGFDKAEVTLGGVATDELSSKTMESKRIAGLYFAGEVVDVTGWLGGYNFQWAWSSGWAAGQFA
ncbi:MAG: NAD(P)/FAD-dependent oxidoreductase [Acidobacteriota bacterium]